jgi:lipopolysaccharide biosynthesis glycosyltransferase
MEICIVVSSDNAYAKHLGVMLYSLLSTADSKAKFIIHVLNGGISKTNVDKISDLISGFGSTVHFIDMDKRVYSKYPVGSHFRPSVYYRISIQYLISFSYSKVIYLDCDMIIQDDISKLWIIDVSEHILSAVEDSGFKNNDRLFMPNNTPYFNAGVMLINLDKWREADISGKAHKFIHEYPERLLLADQDALNAVICGNWKPLHPRWNQQAKMFRLRHTETSFSEHELSEALQLPAIIHFTESSKPWHIMNEHPFRDEYFKFLQCTKWKYRYPKIQNHINSIMKPIVGASYNLLDYLKARYGGALNICNGLLGRQGRG